MLILWKSTQYNYLHFVLQIMHLSGEEYFLDIFQMLRAGWDKQSVIPSVISADKYVTLIMQLVI